MVPCEGTFYHSLRHARTDSRNDLKHMMDSNHHFDLFCWIFIRRSFGSPGSPYWTVGMPGTSKNRDAWCKLEKKTPSLTAKTEPRGSEKWSLATWNGKNAYAAVPKKSCCAEVYRSTCPFHHQNPNFCRSNNGLLDATLSQNVKWQSFRLHALQPFLIVSSAAIGLQNARNHLGFTVQEHTGFTFHGSNHTL